MTEQDKVDTQDKRDLIGQVALAPNSRRAQLLAPLGLPFVLAGPTTDFTYVVSHVNPGKLRITATLVSVVPRTSSEPGPEKDKDGKLKAEALDIGLGKVFRVSKACLEKTCGDAGCRCSLYEGVRAPRCPVPPMHGGCECRIVEEDLDGDAVGEL